ncbi:hypothetical protein HF521_011745 [Silurus meridionalis]|uniref:Uncharacterized protein n=1 Tax=Silurus meridionalis TaxID=175797 RepID=A0A8T0AGF1_SILME|nr:hypothetical protein HF521_011745 [Silurus meridionalis]
MTGNLLPKATSDLQNLRPEWLDKPNAAKGDEASISSREQESSAPRIQVGEAQKNPACAHFKLDLLMAETQKKQYSTADEKDPEPVGGKRSTTKDPDYSPCRKHTPRAVEKGYQRGAQFNLIALPFSGLVLLYHFGIAKIEEAKVSRLQQESLSFRIQAEEAQRNLAQAHDQPDQIMAETQSQRETAKEKYAELQEEVKGLQQALTDLRVDTAHREQQEKDTSEELQQAKAL